MKIYTKTGDDGTTGLFSGLRVSKASARVETYGTVDELNAVIGTLTTMDISEVLKNDLEKLNNLLFIAGSDLATSLEPKSKFEVQRIGEQHIKWLENLIDNYTDQLPELKEFILPGGTTTAGFLHIARTVCRRAERRAIELSNSESIGDYIIKFLNRLSDYLFTASRLANQLAGKADVVREKKILF